ncbi:MAG: inorganic phosphate transporter [Bacteroidales bacterium]|nr:inorganic phosphate transporter [Bacteroidales bacterium]
MEQYYFLIVGVIFVLAFFDIVVGVTNDAVNFMGSAIGSDAAPFWLINVIVSIGILLGVSFSDGMMEVAQNGLFVPAKYSFYEIMIVFFSVMLVDILLLDFLNTLGLPTSTTLALIFELLGGAFAISLIRIFGVQHDFSALNEYLNFGFAIKIVSGIIISIILAIAFGIVIQFFARLLFSFNIKKNIHFWVVFLVQ